MSLNWSKLRQIFIPIFFLIIGFVLGKYVVPEKFESQSLLKLHPAKSEYKFINPLIAVDVAGSKNFEEFKPLKDELNNYIEENKTEKKVRTVSVYFRELETGKWLGINENQTYHPASLFKVPIMIAYLKAEETDPNVLNSSLVFTNDMVPEPTKQLIAPEPLVPGKTYTVRELIIKMITNSSNEAKDALANHITSNFLEEVFTDLNIHSTDKEISAKTYSLFFRTLYNATLLNRNLSEAALELLSKTDFRDGLVAGVPPNITVAHKFGEYSEYVDGKFINVELHDCGIIYAPKNPYALCVMTKDGQLSDLEKIIQDIGRIVYEKISKAN